jgi:histidine triad (HIT) family protein
MNNCIFCKIINKEIPIHKVYEDGNVLAFLDINPASPGHTLVIPKNHYANLEELPDPEAGLIMAVARKVGANLLSGLGAAGYNLIQSNGAAAGQEVLHFHLHVIPRGPGDGLKFWKPQKYELGQAEDILNKIKIN